MNNIDKNNFLSRIIICETLTLPFDGMSSGHIKTHFDTINEFTDTASALKNKMHLWQKPALYSCISQTILLISSLTTIKDMNPQTVLNIIETNNTIENYNYSFLRNPDFLLKRTIDNASSSPHENENIESLILPLTSAAQRIFFPIENASILNSILEYILFFTSNEETIVFSIFMNFLIEALTKPTPGNFLDLSIISADETILFCEDNQPLFFEKKINPDNIISFAKTIKNLFLDLIKDPSNYNNIILNYLNSQTKNNVTRITVEKCISVIPHAIIIASGNVQENLQSIIKKGGSSKYTSAYYGALSSFQNMNDIYPKTLTETIINKNNLFDFIDKITNSKIKFSDVNSFFESEIPLTKKMIDELNSHNKKGKNIVKKKTKKKYLSKHEQLSRHVVESWTKVDKARYVKEKRKNKNDYEEI